ncbi:hypothetical protein P171DRAFT_111029 [Karstenula rhodostoma CBS 690.94]|uniref:Uncharacterized protein n=1 Tax=Karstenula rhodostoma CBS 690.94 TaxID=1392251 RepID=A0A9P4U877_9PLEO|nr:hypothetical protein P171DRAFT_111029 [Karstenula rhodostoma CBS 690.94]
MGRQAVKFEARVRGSHLLFLSFSRVAQTTCGYCAVFTLNWRRSRQLELYRASPPFGKVTVALTDPRKYRRRGFAHRSVSDRLQANTQCRRTRNAGEQRGSNNKTDKPTNDDRLDRTRRRQDRLTSPCVPAELLLVWAELEVA